MPGYGRKKNPMRKHGGKINRNNYVHGGGAIFITISKVKNKGKNKYKKK